MKTIRILVLLLFIISLQYFVKPYEVSEGFRGGRRGGGRRGGGRRGGGRRARRRARRAGRRHWRRSGWSNWYNPYPWYYAPFVWDYSPLNWFDYRTCPSGCVANSYSPTGYTCVGSGIWGSCRSDADCASCNVPLVGYY